MKASTSISVTFAATQEQHRVNLLLTLTGDAPVARPPVNVALVLDQSGSMDGEPLAHARDAALTFASYLTETDRLSVVAFASDARLLYGPGPGNAPEARDAIRQLTAGGQTNLSAGWLEAHRQVGRQPVAGTNRILLLTDGATNQGILDPATLRRMTAGAAELGVSTSCIGFGPGFNEDLLRDLSRGGAGHFWYVQSADQMSATFQDEIEGLVSLAAQNVVVEVQLTHPAVAGVSFVPALPVTHADDGTWRLPLGDLYAAHPRTLGVVFHVEEAGVLGPVLLGQLRLRADVLHGQGVEHRTIELPIRANLDRQDRVEPTVEAAFLRFAIAAAREAAVGHADRGEVRAAADELRAVAEACRRFPGMPELVQAREELLAEAAQLEADDYATEDRKYLMARAELSYDGRDHAAERLRRGRRAR